MATQFGSVRGGQSLAAFQAKIKAMRACVFLACMSLLIGSTVQAGEEEPGWSFTDRWLATQKHEWGTRHGKAESQVFLRFVRSEFGPIQVGNLMYLKMPIAALSSEVGKAFDPKEISETLRLAFGIPAWKTRKQGNAWVLESPWPIMHRDLKFYIKEERGFLTYAFANYRSGFSDAIYYETEILQRYLTNSLRVEGRKGGRASYSALAPILERFFMAPRGAFAALPSTPSTGLGEVLIELHKINGTVESMGKGIKQTAESIDKVEKTVKDSIDKVTAEAQKVSKQAQKIADQATKLGDKALAAAGKLQKSWDRTNQLLAKGLELSDSALKVLENALSPGNAFAVGFASAAGGAIGVATVGLALDGLSKLIATITEAITGEQEKKKFIGLFVESAKQIREITPQLAALDDELNGNLELLKLIAEAGGREKLITKRSVEAKLMEKIKKQHSELNEWILDRGLSSCKEAELVVELEDSLERQIGRNRNIIEVLRKTNVNSICEKVNRDHQAVARAEALLNQLRPQILRAEPYWQMGLRDEFKEDLGLYKDMLKKSLADARRQAQITADMMLDGWLSIPYEVVNNAPEVLECIRSRTNPMYWSGDSWAGTYSPKHDRSKLPAVYQHGAKREQYDDVLKNATEFCRSKYLVENPLGRKKLDEMRSIRTAHFGMVKAADEHHKQWAAVIDDLTIGSLPKAGAVIAEYSFLDTALMQQTASAISERTKAVESRGKEAAKLCADMKKSDSFLGRIN